MTMLGVPPRATWEHLPGVTDTDVQRWSTMPHRSTVTTCSPTCSPVPPTTPSEREGDARGAHPDRTQLTAKHRRAQGRDSVRLVRDMLDLWPLLNPFRLDATMPNWARRSAKSSSGTGSTAGTSGTTGPDHYQVRRYDAWYRHITLAMLAHNYLAVIAPKPWQRPHPADTWQGQASPGT